jgi:hypothetical protein
MSRIKVGRFKSSDKKLFYEFIKANKALEFKFKPHYLTLVEDYDCFNIPVYGQDHIIESILHICALTDSSLINPHPYDKENHLKPLNVLLDEGFSLKNGDEFRFLTFN